MNMIAVGGPLNGQMLEGGSRPTVAPYIPESHKRILREYNADPVVELRLITTRYRRELIALSSNGLQVVGAVWLWEELKTTDPAVTVMCLAHLLAGAMVRAEKV